MEDAIADLPQETLAQGIPTSHRVKGGLIGGVGGGLAARVYHGDKVVDPVVKVLKEGVTPKSIKDLSSAMPGSAKVLPLIGAGLGILAANRAWRAEAPQRADKNVEIARGLSRARLTQTGDLLESMAKMDQLRDRLEASKTAAVGSYVNDAAAAPKPVSQPKVSAPSTPSSMSLAKATKAPTPDSPSLVPTGSSNTTGGAPPSATGKTAEDASILPLLGIGAGGAGGYLLGKKVINPYLHGREAAVRAEIAKQMAALGNYQTAQKYVPAGAALTGAILLATLLAGAGRGSDTSRSEDAGYAPPRPEYRRYYGGMGGYNPNDARYYG